MSHLLGKSLHVLCKGIGRRAIALGELKRSLIRHYRVNEGRNSTGSERPRENVKRESRILSEVARNTVIVIGGVVVVAVYELSIFIKDQASEVLHSITQSVKSAKDSMVQKAEEVVKEGDGSVIEGGKIPPTVSNGAEKTNEDVSSGLHQSSSSVFESAKEGRDSEELE